MRCIAYWGTLVLRQSARFLEIIEIRFISTALFREPFAGYIDVGSIQAAD